jgi:hypothetical protein
VRELCVRHPVPGYIADKVYKVVRYRAICHLAFI